MEAETEDAPELLDELSSTIEERWPEVGDDRKMFVRGIRHLRDGELKEASRVFRRATRKGDGVFCVMARMAQARCEVVRDRQGSALRLFQKVADSESKAPEKIRQMAWMEIADLARERGDEALLETARQAVSKRTSPVDDDV